MNTKTLMLAGAALAAYWLWKQSQAPAQSASSGGTAASSTLTSSPLMAAAITAGAAFAAYHYGPPEVKGAALGVLGIMAARNLPIVRDGIDAQVLAA